jgi:hypothetical protein
MQRNCLRRNLQFCIARAADFSGVRLTRPVEDIYWSWRWACSRSIAISLSRKANSPNTDHGAQRHEGEEHQRAAIAFKTGGFEDFDPGELGAKCRAWLRRARPATNPATPMTRSSWQWSCPASEMHNAPGWVATRRDQVQCVAEKCSGRLRPHGSRRPS